MMKGFYYWIFGEEGGTGTKNNRHESVNNGCNHINNKI